MNEVLDSRAWVASKQQRNKPRHSPADQPIHCHKQQAKHTRMHSEPTLREWNAQLLRPVSRPRLAPGAKRRLSAVELHIPDGPESSLARVVSVHSRRHCSTNEYKASNRQSAQWHRRRKPMGTFQPRVAVDRFRLEPKLASFGPISQLTLGSPSSFEGVAEPILSWYGSFRAGAARERSEARMNEPMARLRNNAQLDRSPKATTLLSAQARC